MANKKLVKVNAELKLRYIDDAIRIVTNVQTDLKDVIQLISLHQKKLLVSANLNKSKTKSKILSTLNTKELADLTSAFNKFKPLYLLASDLHDKKRILETLNLQLVMQFSEHSGTAYNKIESSIAELKTKVKANLELVLANLDNKVASLTPNNFLNYTQSIFNLTTTKIKNQDFKTFLHITIKQEELIFNRYLYLVNSVNDNHEVIPNLYLGLHWIPARNVMAVTLTTEFIPNAELELIELTNLDTNFVLAEVANLLVSEQFSNRVACNNTLLDFNLIPTYKELIKSVSVTSRTLVFNLVKSSTESSVKNTLYKELKALVKSTGHKVFIEATNSKLTCSFQKVDNYCLPVNSYDVEFMRDLFKLNNTQIQKITNLLL